MDREEEIRKIAYQIWEQEGCPHGRDCEHWSQAEQIWDNSKPRVAAAAPKKHITRSVSGKKTGKK